ncbi:20262_t:CDS:2 [Cetraspora pellucida]|uniref:20262_t:CDS:1 n=1 Tax=Cetraspora pellucida TaxID=1433469 RepID=A0A9N9AIE4_9GLOM|nr:20262_t:CDS:2 [Cetraspora pellucida]
MLKDLVLVITLRDWIRLTVIKSVHSSGQNHVSRGSTLLVIS